MTTGPQDPAAAGGGRLRAGHADREQAIETLKSAFVHGRLTKEEFDARAGQALIAWTCADLASLTADIPPGPVVAAPARPPAPARRWPLARATAGSVACLGIAAAAVWAAGLADPGPPGPTPYHYFAPLCLLIAFFAAFMALVVFGYGVAVSVEQRQSRRQLPPPPPGTGDGTASGGGERGPDPAPPSRRSDPACAGLRVRKSRRHRYVSARAGWPRGARPALGASPACLT